MMKNINALLTLLLFMFAVGCTSAPKKEPKVVAVSIIAPIQLPSQGTPITGGRTSFIWGKHDSVTGVDFGLLGNFTEKEFRGSAASIIFNSTKGKAEIDGFQMAGLLNLNRGTTSIKGFQLGTLNIGKKNKVYGIQVGVYNEAEAIYGFQVGVINRTKSLYGIQIGLLNFSSKNGMPFFPILNAGF